jgi:hypothetical protein
LPIVRNGHGFIKKLQSTFAKGVAKANRPIGLKARKKIAQGKRSAALGQQFKMNFALKGRDRVSSRQKGVLETCFPSPL